MSIDTKIAINPLAVLPVEKTPRRYTLAEYLRKEERSETLHEYYDGYIKKLPMAKGPHNQISANMTTELTVALRANRNYHVMTGQQLVYFPKLNRSVYPDILVVCELPEYYDSNEVLLINPVLVVEVLSKSTGKYDRTGKFDDYKTLDSFKEYVLIDQKKCLVETRFRAEPNIWHEATYTQLTDSILLKSPDCAIDMSLIYDKINLEI